jgi:hypothetical protein
MEAGFMLSKTTCPLLPMGERAGKVLNKYSLDHTEEQEIYFLNL